MPIDPKKTWNFANSIRHDRMQEMSDIDDAAMLLRQQNPRGIIHYAQLTTIQSRGPSVSANLFNESVTFTSKNRQYNACLFVPFGGTDNSPAPALGMAVFEMKINGVQQTEHYFAPATINNNNMYLDTSSINFIFPFLVPSGTHTITITFRESIGGTIELFANILEPIRFWIEDVGSTILGGEGIV